MKNKKDPTLAISIAFIFIITICVAIVRHLQEGISLSKALVLQGKSTFLQILFTALIILLMLIVHWMTIKIKQNRPSAKENKEEIRD